jgi:oligopeptide transport system substrate-binding protein
MIVLVLALAALGGAAGSACSRGPRPRPRSSDGRATGSSASRTSKTRTSTRPRPASSRTGEFQRALFEPLVTLDARLQPVPALAERWETSADGLTVTFHLRGDGRWTNGDPVTAHDFEWSWKRVLAPETKSARAPHLAGIAGASAYNACQSDCARLRDGVGVRALDDRTLAVRLATPRPWFPAETAQPPFYAVHRPTVERYGAPTASTSRT